MNATKTMSAALLALEDAASVLGAAWSDSVARQPIAALRAALDASGDDVDILAAYSRTDGRREWVSVGTWLRPGEVVAHMDDPRPNASLSRPQQAEET